APHPHRGADVDQQIDRQVLVFLEQAHRAALEPAEEIPVQVAQVVAGRVVAMVGELEPGPDAPAAPHAVRAPGGRAADGERQRFELAQESRVESALGRRRLRRAERTRRRHGISGSRVSNLPTSASAVIPSASPSKLSSTRWRKAGIATRRTSEKEGANRPARSASNLAPRMTACAPRGELP